MPFYEAAREARRTLLLGDLGTGKSTLAAQLVLDQVKV
jgi:DNA replication protein DnaC